MVFMDTPFFYMRGEDELIAAMISLLGDVPSEWQTKWQEIQHSSGRSHPPGTAMDSKFKLENVFQICAEVPELMPLLPVVQGLLRYLPSDRMSAAEAKALLKMEGLRVGDNRAPWGSVE